MTTIMVLIIVGGAILSFVITALLLASKYSRQPGQALLSYLALPLICLLLYVIGGADLLGLVIAQLFTWRGTGIVLAVVLGAAGVTWLRRRIVVSSSVWPKVVEVTILLGIIALGIRCIARSAPLFTR